MSIVYAAQVNGKLAAGDIAGAQESSAKAKKWAIWSAIAAVVVGVLYGILIVALGGMGAMSNSGYDRVDGSGACAGSVAACPPCPPDPEWPAGHHCWPPPARRRCRTGAAQRQSVCRRQSLAELPAVRADRPVPGCGSTRCLYSLVHFDLPGAMAMNPLLVISLPFLLLMLLNVAGIRPRVLDPLMRILGNPMFWLWVLPGYALLRNLPWAPFTALAPV